MGQKIEFNPDDWGFPEENASEEAVSDTSIPVKIASDTGDQDFVRFELDEEPLAFEQELLAYDDFDEEPSAFDEEPSAFDEEPSVFVKEISVTSEESSIPANKSKDSPEEKRIYISHKHSGSPISEQEEEAFRKQIEDLFELLELEKATDKSAGIRVYQTDSSPSRPWRFH
ncbi:MAG: hypothetical protein QNL62_08415 [Gammaproteobacteria bacterium]|nr:hypothetical protein [Gammaproteobacteria bacterium]